MSARRTRGGDLKDSKEEGGEETVAVAEAEATSDSGMEMPRHEMAGATTDLTLNAESNRESKKPRLSSTEAASNESLTAMSSPEVSGKADVARPIDELGDASAGGKVGGGAMQRDAGKVSMDESEVNSGMKANAPESAHLLALASGTSLSDAVTPVVALVSYKSLISSMARANRSSRITTENYYILHWLYRIRNVSCLRGLRISFLHPDFLWSIYGPMMRSKKLRRTNRDIRVAVKIWCSNRAGAEERYGHISDWDVSGVTDMEELFEGKITFNNDISRWDLSKVTTTKGMFLGAHAFNQPVGDWDVSNVTDMSSMFWDARAFNQPVGDWNVSKVTKMSFMFSTARVFNQPVGDWDVSKVTDVSYMFRGAYAFNQPVGNWEVSKVNNMSFMFFHAHAFNQSVGDWDVSNVTNMEHMFGSAHSFNQPVGDWDVSRVTNMWCMFCGAHSFNQVVGSWDLSEVTNMRGMFCGAHAFDQDLTRWDMRYVRAAGDMFRNAHALQRDNKPATVRDDVYDEGEWEEDETAGVSYMGSKEYSVFF